MALPPKVRRRRLLVGCLPNETVHCCQVTSVGFSDSCSDATYPGHRPPYCAPPTPHPPPPPRTLFAKSWSRNEWASPPESRLPLRPSTNPPIWTLWLWRLWSELPQQGKRQEHWDWCPWHEGPQKLWQFYLSWNDRWGDTRLLSIRLLDPPTLWNKTKLETHPLTVLVIPVLTRPRNCSTCGVSLVITVTPQWTHPQSGWCSAVWAEPFHWAFSTPSSG